MSIYKLPNLYLLRISLMINKSKYVNIGFFVITSLRLSIFTMCSHSKVRYVLPVVYMMQYFGDIRAI